MDFEKIDLKPLSWEILSYMYDKPAMKSEEVAAGIQKTKRQVDAAITKSLVRWGFVIRQAKLTPVLKKDYNEVYITERGKKYVEWRHDFWAKAQSEKSGE